MKKALTLFAIAVLSHHAQAASPFNSLVPYGSTERGAGSVVQNLASGFVNQVSNSMKEPSNGTDIGSVGQVFQQPPVPGSTIGKSNCNDLEGRVKNSSQEYLTGMMPDSTPNQALENNGVFDTLKKKVSFLGDLIGGLFDFFTGNFTGAMDTSMNRVASNAFSAIGSPFSGNLFQTVVGRPQDAATDYAAGTLNGAIRDFQASSAVDTTGLVRNLARENQNNLTSMIQSGLPITNYTQGTPDKPGSAWFKYADTQTDVPSGARLACTSQTCLDQTGRVVTPSEAPGLAPGSVSSANRSVW